MPRAADAAGSWLPAFSSPSRPGSHECRRTRDAFAAGPGRWMPSRMPMSPPPLTPTRWVGPATTRSMKVIMSSARIWYVIGPSTSAVWPRPRCSGTMTRYRSARAGIWLPRTWAPPNPPCRSVVACPAGAPSRPSRTLPGPDRPRRAPGTAEVACLASRASLGPPAMQRLRPHRHPATCVRQPDGQHQSRSYRYSARDDCLIGGLTLTACGVIDRPPASLE